MEYLKNVKFIKSVFNKQDLIRDDLPIIAMVGKSNVGKSSLYNAILNEEKAIVSNGCRSSFLNAGIASTVIKSP